MKLREIMQDIEYEIIQHGDVEEVASIAIDSRRIEENSLFICLRGLTADGHTFIKDASAKHAAAIVIDRD